MKIKTKIVFFGALLFILLLIVIFLTFYSTLRVSA